MSKFGIDWTASDETSGERDAGHLLSCLEFAWNCLASHGLLEQAQQLAERIDSKRCARLSQAGAGGVVVKPLVWEYSTGHLPHQEVWSSGDPWTFWIVKNGDGPYVWCENLGFADMVPASPVRGEFATLDEAKAAAQADYDARIRSALAGTPPAPVQTASVEAVAWQWRHSGEKGWRLSWEKPFNPGIELKPLYATPPAPVPSVGEPAGWQRRTRNPDRSWGPWREAGQAEFDGRSTELGVEVGLVEYREVYATPPAPVQTASVEGVALREALKDLCDAWDDKNDGGKYRGNVTEAHRAARFVLASLTPAPTQGGIPTWGDAGPIPGHHFGDEFDREPTPSPAPVSAPSPAGEVREALGKIDLRVLSDVQRLGDGVSFGGSNDRVRAISLIERGFLSGSYQNAKLTEAGRAALSSPATPEPVSAPANGEVVDQAEINRIRDWLLERNHDHLLAAQENRITMMRVRSDTEMFLDAAILLSHLAALSNPAPGHGEAVPVVEPWLCGGCGQTDPAKRCLGCLHGLPPPHRR